MQDKDFDQLFKDKFEDAQVEPSSNLWINIEQELTVKRKRRFPIYWSAAAAIIAAVSAAFLLHEPEKIQLHAEYTAAPVRAQHTEEGIVQSTQQLSVQNNVVAMQTASTKTGHHTEVSRFETVDAVVKESSIANQPVPIVESNSDKKDLLAMQPLSAIAHPTIKETLKEPVAELPVARAVPEEEIMLASAESIKEFDDSENRQTEGKRIRNVGDLVNYVVDKVDKREEKFIQFKTDDDDNSSIIALNIGMFRFNQKKHK